MASMLVVLRFLDDPYHPGVGSLQPVAMERTLELIDEALSAVGRSTRIPCTETGTQVGS